MPLEPTPLDPLEMTTAGSDPELEPAATASGQEVDVWWGAYAGRSMIPMFALCTLVSVNISLIIGWAWDEERLDPQIMWHLAVFLIAAVWFFPLCLWVHRSLSYNYRLTNRYLYRDRGFYPPRTDRVELARITRVEVEYTLLERPFGVGRVRVETNGAAPLTLEGVFDPKPVAERVRRQAEVARQRT